MSHHPLLLHLQPAFIPSNSILSAALHFLSSAETCPIYIRCSLALSSYLLSSVCHNLDSLLSSIKVPSLICTAINLSTSAHIYFVSLYLCSILYPYPILLSNNYSPLIQLQPPICLPVSSLWLMIRKSSHQKVCKQHVSRGNQVYCYCQVCYLINFHKCIVVVYTFP